MVARATTEIATAKSAQANQAITTYVITQGMPSNDSTYLKTFQNVGQYSEFAQWLSDVLIPNVYPTTWYNSAPMSFNESEYLVAGNLVRRVGGMLMWQVRVPDGSCTGAFGTGRYKSRFARPSGQCFPAWGSAQMTGDTAPFIPSGPHVNKSMPYMYTPNVTGATAGAPRDVLLAVPGYGRYSYGTGGYPIYFPDDASTAQQLMQRVISDEWIDAQTRAVAVDFNLYNQDTNLLSVVRIVMEFPPDGNLIGSYRIYTFKLLLYDSVIDYLRLVGEIVIVLGCVYYLAIEVSQLVRRGAKVYLRQWSNAFDVTLQAMMFALIVYWIVMITDPLFNGFAVNGCGSPIWDPALVNSAGNQPQPCWVDMTGYAQQYNDAIVLAGAYY